MFLYRFEQIVRAAVAATGGPADWALPYWNYGLGGRNATLPLAFRQPTLAGGEPNPLYVEQRAAGINSGASLPAAATSPAHALARHRFTGSAEFGGNVTTPGQFWQATGRLEQTPHNDIHNFVGGEGIMGNVLTAAQDPIFWLHHANIDRLWSVWSAAPEREDPSEPQWREQAFEFFDDGGHQVSMKCADVLDTLADLGYTYDTTPPPAAVPVPAPTPATPAPTAAAPPPPGPAAVKAPEPEMIGASQRGLELVGAPASVSILIDGQAAKQATAAARHIYLNVEDIEGDTNPGTVYGIYANLPEGAPPDLEAAHHVGNLSFFGIERARNPRGDEASHGLRVAVDITPLARELQARGQWEGHTLIVTFRPLTLTPPEVPDEQDPVRPPSGNDTPVRIGRVSVFYDA